MPCQVGQSEFLQAELVKRMTAHRGVSVGFPMTFLCVYVHINVM